MLIQKHPLLGYNRLCDFLDTHKQITVILACCLKFAACVVANRVISGMFFFFKKASDQQLILKAIIFQNQSVSDI